MNRKLIAIFVVPALVGLGGIVCAQDTSFTLTTDQVKSLNKTQWQETLENAKGDISNLIAENDKLEKEHQFLLNKLSSLYKDVDTARGEVTRQQEENIKLKNARHERKEQTALIKKEIGQMEAEIRSIEKDKEGLERKLKKMEGKSKIWELKLSDLQNQKRQLMLDIKMKEIAKDDIAKSEGVKVKELEDQLAQLQDQEAKMDEKIVSLNQTKNNLPGEINEAKKQNLELDKKIAEFMRKKKQQDRLNRSLLNDNERLAARATDIPASLVNEKRALERRIADLEGQLEKIKATIAKTSKTLESKRELLDEILIKDEENQKLRKQVANLIEEINKAKSEVPAW